VIARAVSAGCRAMLCIATSSTDIDKVAAVAQQHPGLVWATAGVHPHEAAASDLVHDGDAIRAAAARGAVAIGECGLDYHYDHSPREVQRRVLSAQIELARELSRPLVVHTREADADMIDCIADAHSAGVIGILHCFTGGPALAEAGLAAGWYVSFAGVVTFRKWDGDALIRMVPDDRLLAESDAPYLAPAPLRGKRNEPAYVARTVERLAHARGRSAEEVGSIVLANAQRLFGLVLATDAV